MSKPKYFLEKCLEVSNKRLTFATEIRNGSDDNPKITNNEESFQRSGRS